MKYNILHNISVAFAAIAMLWSAASCNKEESPLIPEEPTAQTITLSASMELPDADTKTSLDGLNVKWSAGDNISVFFGSNTANTEFTLSTGSGETSGSFTGTPSETSSTIYAVYPYKASTSISGSTVTLSLPAVQTYKEGSFNEGMNPAVAYTSTGGNLTFKNLCGVLKLQLKVESGTKTIKKISVYNAGGKLSGQGTVVMTDETPTLTMSNTASNSVTLDLGVSGVELTTTAKTFYIVVPATTGTYTVTVFDSEGKTKTKSTSSAITRNKIL